MDGQNYAVSLLNLNHLLTDDATGHGLGIGYIQRKHLSHAPAGAHRTGYPLQFIARPGCNRHFSAGTGQGTGACGADAATRAHDQGTSAVQAEARGEGKILQAHDKREYVCTVMGRELDIMREIPRNASIAPMPHKWS